MALDVIAGGLAGGSGILAGYPFDTVKGLIQNQVKIKYTSTFQALCLVTKEEGFKRLYRGLSTPLVTVAFYNAVTFGVYAKALKHLDHISIGGQNNDLAKHTIAGLTSGIARTFFISPIEVVKIQMQVVPREKPMTVFQCVGYIYKNAGLKGFARGYLLCFGREPLAFATYFGSFELMTKNHKDNHLVTFVAGGIAGILSWVPTYPQDVIKTRLQADHIGAKAFYKNTWHCIQYTLKDSGVGILYRGMGSCVYRAFVVNSVVFYVYTQVTSKFQDKF